MECTYRRVVSRLLSKSCRSRPCLALARSRERTIRPSWRLKGRRVGRRAREGRTAAGTADEGVALAVPQQEQEEQREEVWDL